jgi:ribosomal protein L11 methyltransferase
VTFLDALDDPVLEPLPGEVRLWPATRVQALFAAGVHPGPITDTLSTRLGIPVADIEMQQVEDRAWEREWLRDFHPMRFGERLWVCPWHERISDAEAAVIVGLDPGLAFGTGTHPTTALCLEWLDAHIGGAERVIDYGCGSGILAIAAVKLGGAHAHCFDIDPQALLATGENARANAVGSQITICPSTQALPADVEVLVANILSAPLRQLARSFATRVHPGGHVVLAGLLEQEAGDVTQAYRPWFDMSSFGDREGWVGLSGRRRIRIRRN